MASRWEGLLRRRDDAGLMPLDVALAAMGQEAVMERRGAEVPVAQIVGTVARSEDFDECFRPRHRRLQDRSRRVLDLVTSGVDEPVDLIQLGELYFVVDGHHRVSAARQVGRHDIAATVVRICTVAYAMGCLRTVHLRSKAAERRFLERIPLPWDVRADLWLPEPADWARLADAAESWGFRQTLRGRQLTDRERLAGVWWAEEVLPVLHRLRDVQSRLDLRDVQLYSDALAARDRHGWTTWPDDDSHWGSLFESRRE